MTIFKKAKMNARMSVLAVGALALGSITGVGIGSVVSAAAAGHSHFVAEATFPTNANGQTYGSALGAATPPDLVLASATNGEIGYVYFAQLNSASGGNIASPQQALAWDEQTHQAATIPVYESDGTTVIGEFSISGGEPIITTSSGGQ